MVWVQATTPMAQAPPLATAAIASTAQTTRQQAQSAPVTTHAQALAQPLPLAPATTGTTPPLTPTAQAVDSRAMFQGPLSTRPTHGQGTGSGTGSGYDRDNTTTGTGSGYSGGQTGSGAGYGSSNTGSGYDRDNTTSGGGGGVKSHIPGTPEYKASHGQDHTGTGSHTGRDTATGQASLPCVNLRTDIGTDAGSAYKSSAGCHHGRLLLLLVLVQTMSQYNLL